MIRPIVLVAPLHWGLGHASRCIPVIRSLQKNGAEVIVAATGSCAEFIKGEIDVKIIECPVQPVSYGKKFLKLNLLLQAPALFKSVNTEKKFINHVVEKYGVHAVISDNRYGLFSKKIPSVLITHQVNIKAGVFSPFINRINHSYIRQFNECWIPDDVSSPFSGDLSSSVPVNIKAKNLGILSRFGYNYDKEEKYEILFLNSGPEPMRSLFAELVTKQLKALGTKAFVVLGVPGLDYTIRQEENITFAQHLKQKELAEIILQSKLVIARSGYSTIMDLARLGKRAAFIPTPGQTEQEYLATYLEQKRIAPFQLQRNLNVKQLIKQAELYEGFKKDKETDSLDVAVKSLLNTIRPS